MTEGRYELWLRRNGKLELVVKGNGRLLRYEQSSQATGGKRHIELELFEPSEYENLMSDLSENSGLRPGPDAFPTEAGKALVATKSQSPSQCQDSLLSDFQKEQYHLQCRCVGVPLLMAGKESKALPKYAVVDDYDGAVDLYDTLEQIFKNSSEGTVREVHEVTFKSLGKFKKTLKLIAERKQKG